LLGAVGSHKEQGWMLAFAVRNEHDGCTIRSPRGRGILALIFGEAAHVRSIGIHGENLEFTGAVRSEGNLTIIGRPGGRECVFGQPFRVTAVRIHHPDRRIAAGVGQGEFVEGDFLPIVRPHWPAGVAGADGGQAFLAAAVSIHHIDLRVLVVTQRAECDLGAVGRDWGSKPFTCRSVMPVPSGFMKASRFILASEVEWYCILGLPTELIATAPCGCWPSDTVAEPRVSAESIAIDDDVVIMGSGRTKTIFSEG